MPGRRPLPRSDRSRRSTEGGLAEPGPVTAAASVRRGGEEAPLGHNIHTYLANNLGREIVGGVYPPGSLLPAEIEMLARFAVSRTALREAYRVLAAKGLIVSRSKVGTRVRPKTDWNMLDPEVLAWHMQTVPTEDLIADLYVLRQVVEPAAAALAASGRPAAAIERIGAAYADMERFKDGAGDLIAADLRFHLAILEATGNRFIGALGSLVHAALLCTFKLSWAGAARIQDDRLRQHRAIFEAIRDGSPTRARARMNDLLRDSINDVREFLRRRDGVRRRSEPKRTIPSFDAIVDGVE
jgi:GntR family transcriptional regulator, galactonate operon transcriptional repressor